MSGFGRLRHRAVLAASARPRLYFGLRRLTGTHDRLCVGRDTDIVIEGFPRSANSTTVTHFRLRQSRPVAIAHHKHHAAQLIRAADWGIPAVALVRPPRDAVVSLLAMLEEARQRRAAGEADPAGGAQREGAGIAGGVLIENGPDFEGALRWWTGFYRPLLPLRGAMVVVPFEQATGDIADVIEAVNARFGTDFQSAETTRSRKRRFGFRSMPNPLRDTVKREIAAALVASLDKDTALRARADEAEALHARFLAGE
ncbi:hypothetical protein [Microbaculum sp. FT89]|uniref:hypothetical protein n=1 Tax=Microbaculum sp. FT89 TaxID=3447298 RepID=UPI003F529AFA